MDEEEDWELSCSDVGILGVMRSSVVFSKCADFKRSIETDSLCPLISSSKSISMVKVSEGRPWLI